MLIYNAEIYTMDNDIIKNGYVEIVDGKIRRVASGFPKETGEEDIDALGKLLLPGFIDAHTHLGIIEDGLGFEGDDSNEETDPVTPQLRAADGINPFDRCFEEAREAGITTVIVSPGSANTICGEVCAIKTFGRRIDDMVIKTVAMKFALGENPKMVYNSKSETPITRMATAALIREALFKAKKYALDIENAKNDDELDEPEFDIKSQALIPLLERKIKAHFHAHRADDIFTAIRICKEFDIDCVLIHATEGYKIADILGKEKIPAVVGPVICDRSKPELRRHGIENAGVLDINGVKTAICTDHPEVPIQYLPLSAALSVRGGMDRMSALKALTINPAEICGIADRAGSITQGKDADLLMFSGDPFDVMSQPEMVMIDGTVVFRS
ncbi:MAG: amidohydrolase [Oscillospiraceae bacterium]|jgi:imidazolonepropionase-like amidohydrolase